MPPVNPYNKYIKQYQASNVNTATPEKLMIMMFDGALQFLQKAKVKTGIFLSSKIIQTITAFTLCLLLY